MSVGAGTPSIAAVLFSDVVGSTQLRTRIGDRAMDEIRREHDHAVGEAVTASGPAT